MSPRSAVKRYVIAVGFDPGDLADRDEVGALGFTDKQAFRKAAPMQDFSDQGPQAGRRNAGVSGILRMLPAGTTNNFAEAILRNRFQQVIERVDFEGLESIAIVRSNEDESRGFDVRVGRNGANDVETIGAGHLNVEENHVGTVLFNRRDCRLTTIGLADNLHVRLGTQQAQELPAGGRFVVDDENAKRDGAHHRSR